MERAVDRRFWISWFDLPKESCNQHIAWLHGSYIPSKESRAHSALNPLRYLRVHSGWDSNLSSCEASTIAGQMRAYTRIGSGQAP
jgi:hypothetical protein